MEHTQTDSVSSTLQVVTYNLHGFNQGQVLLNKLCDNFDIIAVQEHWLTDHDLNKFLHFRADFQGLAWSAMGERLSSGVLVGRPFGGIGLLVKKALNIKIRPVAVHNQCRCVVNMLEFVNGFKLLLSIVYFPCSYTDAYESELLEILGFIEQCVSCNPADGVIMLGDMNFEWTSSSVGGRLFASLADEINLTCCADLGFNQINYTYFQESSGNSSVIDHIFVDGCLSDGVSKYEVYDEFVNLSDHLPVVCCLNLDSAAFRRDDNVHFDSAYNKRNKVGIRRWDKGDLAGYYSMTCDLLQKVYIPRDIDVQCNGSCCTHWNAINNYYSSLTHALTTAAHFFIPVIKENTLKSFWSAELNEAKQASIDAHSLWILCGKPHSGLINDLRRNSKYRYKLAIRQARLTEEMELDDEISQLYLKKNVDKFWKKWHTKFSSNRNLVPSNINGLTEDHEIASVFCSHFSNVCFDSYAVSEPLIEFLNRLHSVIATEEFHSEIFEVADIEHSLNMLKNGRSPGFDDLNKEHFTFCHPSIYVHLRFLFNMIYTHGFVPDDFGKGITIPVPKDKLGNLSNVENYRPITISPIISKMFEYCILEKFQNSLLSCDLQFGFKQKSSCSHAIFLLKQVTDYFIARGSNVYLAALDARKAFDRVHHVKLFGLMLDKGLPGRLVKVVADWYGKTVSIVKWNGCFSGSCVIKSGIRQGGILSPAFI